MANSAIDLEKSLLECLVKRLSASDKKLWYLLEPHLNYLQQLEIFGGTLPIKWGLRIINDYCTGQLMNMLHYILVLRNRRETNSELIFFNKQSAHTIGDADTAYNQVLDTMISLAGNQLPTLERITEILRIRNTSFRQSVIFGGEDKLTDDVINRLTGLPSNVLNALIVSFMYRTVRNKLSGDQKVSPAPPAPSAPQPVVAQPARRVGFKPLHESKTLDDVKGAGRKVPRLLDGPLPGGSGRVRNL